MQQCLTYLWFLGCGGSTWPPVGHYAVGGKSFVKLLLGGHRKKETRSWFQLLVGNW